jgi:hypothetical protein
VRRRTLVLFGLAALLVAVAAGVATAKGAAGDPTDLRALPIGDGRTTTSAPRRGYVFECSVMQAGGGAQHAGPWIHADGTFDLTAKAVVNGHVGWPGSVAFAASGASLLVTGNGLPRGATTGIFPIAAADPAYQYDRNPNAISQQQVSWTLPLHPAAAARPGCLSGGPIGIAVNGVAIFDALDGSNRDAVAHETQDSCGGHPERTGLYHYHSIPSCLTNGNPSGLVGYALDGYPIFGPRDPATGKLLTDADLDACHGRTSAVTLGGKRVVVYHYNATREYPYTLGCFHGTSVRSSAAGPRPQGPPPGPAPPRR